MNYIFTFRKYPDLFDNIAANFINVRKNDKTMYLVVKYTSGMRYVYTAI